MVKAERHLSGARTGIHVAAIRQHPAGGKSIFRAMCKLLHGNTMQYRRRGVCRTNVLSRGIFCRRMREQRVYQAIRSPARPLGRNRYASQRRSSSTTEPQSLGAGCRRRVREGYQGVTSPSSPQRQSGACGRST